MKKVKAPYVGIRPFEKDDWPVFFGRESLSNELLYKLENNRFVAVVGSSGSGKSSVVKAGLLPLLEDHKVMRRAKEWLTVTCRPGGDPCGSLARKLVAAGQRLKGACDNNKMPIAVDLLRAMLRTSDRGIITVLESFDLPASTHILIVVDQFEELFGFRETSASDPRAPEEAERFVTCLLDSCKEPIQPVSSNLPGSLAQRVWVVLTMRSDFIGNCEVFPALSKKVSESQFLVPILDPEQKRKAIIRPSLAEEIEAADYSPFAFDDGLVSIIVNESGTRIDQLPLMQHALMRTWTCAARRARDSNSSIIKLTEGDYDSIGRIDKALSQHADAAFAELTKDDREGHKAAITRRLFLLLCDVSSEGKITRRRPTVDEVMQVADASLDQVKSVVEAFQRDSRNFIVTRPPGEEFTSTTRLDVSHEALLRQWSMLSSSEVCLEALVAPEVPDKSAKPNRLWSSFKEWLRIQTGCQQRSDAPRAARGWLAEERDAVTELLHLRQDCELYAQGRGDLLNMIALARVKEWQKFNRPSEAWARHYLDGKGTWKNIEEFISQSTERLHAEQLAQKRKHRITAALACLLALTLIATIWGGYYALVQEHETYYRSFAKRLGFPVGIEPPISKAEAKRLPVSFRLVHKGVTREGWKLRWKPAFRVVAVSGNLVNENLEYTTQHGIGTYLWSGYEREGPQAIQTRLKAASLGLHRVCQWEFVSDAQGKIAYERGLDRKGRMVWGLVYSPGGPDSGLTRLARFVGPDGFSQLQRGSSAEYVEIYYDKNGWEERVMFRDARNESALGPHGAFGKKMTHDARGLLTRSLSLDANGTEMIDNDGNCGVVFSYNQKGLQTESMSVGLDLNPMPFRDGYVSQKFQYGTFGRLRSGAYYGASGEAVLHKLGYHEWTAEYDGRGNLIAQTFMGLDGKPVALADGYASLRLTYNARGNETRRTFHGPSGEPVLHKDGYHGGMAEYDAEDGNLVAATFIGLDGKPVASADGYATWRATYDARGNETRRTFHGPSGEPVLHKDGYHGWIEEYDERGNWIAETSIGLDGKPVALADGYASRRLTYDARGNLTRVRYLGVSDKPVLHKDGNYGWIEEYDERGNWIAETSIGLDGKPVALADGYASLRLTYDARGNETRRTFHGPSGEPVLHKDGYHGRTAEYEERGNLIARTFIGLDGKPVASADGYATWRATYDARGNETRRTFHGPSGEPVLHKDGYHGWTAEYDERSKKIAAISIGLDGKPVASAGGYATWRATYDARGNETRRTFHGPSGEPVLHKDGYHGWTAEYDERSKKIAATSIGLDGKPVASADGYATWRATYDARGNLTRVRYFGVSDKPVLHKDGNHGWIEEYDERGNWIAETSIGLDGKPVASADGYASLRLTYDARGNETRRTFHGPSGEPVLHKDGYHGWTAEYDERSKKIAAISIGLDGKPVASADGYATWKATYDARGNETRRTFHGPSGEPVLHKDGYHGWTAEYDERSKKIAETSIGLDGKPVPSADGYATWRATYDARGNETRRTFHGPSGEPVLHKDGYHGWTAEYDERSKKIAETSIGLDGKPVASADGYATWRATYDARGNETRRTFHGPSGEPVLHKDGYHGRMAEYDEQGNLVSQTWIGMDGQPLPSIIVISEVLAGSGAEAQGIRPGDIVLTYADWEFFPQRGFPLSKAQLDSAIEMTKEQAKAVLVWRDGKMLRFDFGPGLIGTTLKYEQKSRRLLDQIAADYQREQRKVKGTVGAGSTAQLKQP